MAISAERKRKLREIAISTVQTELESDLTDRPTRLSNYAVTDEEYQFMADHYEEAVNSLLRFIVSIRTFSSP